MKRPGRPLNPDNAGQNTGQLIRPGCGQAEKGARASQEHVMAYLVKPIRDDNLVTSIQVAMQRFREFQVLLQETDQLKRDLEERKLIERAKGVLMSRGGLSEADAFRRLFRDRDIHRFMVFADFIHDVRDS